MNVTRNAINCPFQRAAASSPTWLFYPIRRIVVYSRRSTTPTMEMGESVASHCAGSCSRKELKAYTHARASILTGYPGRPDVRVMYDSLPCLPRRNSGRHAGRIVPDLRQFFVPFRQSRQIKRSTFTARARRFRVQRDPIDYLLTRQNISSFNSIT